MEFKPVFLLVDEERDLDCGTITTTRDFYEMPEYKEDFTDEEIEAFLKSELGDTVEIEFIGSENVYFKLRGKTECFKFEKALKIGKEYFKLEKIQKNESERI